MVRTRLRLLILCALLVTVMPQCSLEQAFLYFPSSSLVATPSEAGLPYEDIAFAAADGTQLHGWLIPGEPERPLLLFFHGNAGNISHRIGNLRLLLQRLGVSVFIFDYRGYGRSEGRIDEEGLYADARGALQWLKRRGWDEERIIYFGRSLGAAVALHLALEAPPAGVILESAFTSVQDLGRHHYPLLYRLLGWSVNARYPILEKVGNLRAPLLMLHGDRDTVVPPRMGREVFDRAPEPKSFHPISGAGHNDTVAQGGEAYWKSWRRFLDTIGKNTP